MNVKPCYVVGASIGRCLLESEADPRADPALASRLAELVAHALRAGAREVSLLDVHATEIERWVLVAGEVSTVSTLHRAWAPASDCLHGGACTSRNPWLCHHDGLRFRAGYDERQWRCMCGPCHAETF